jgi:hypothetical protein
MSISKLYNSYKCRTEAMEQENVSKYLESVQQSHSKHDTVKQNF